MQVYKVLTEVEYLCHFNDNWGKKKQVFCLS